MSLAPLVLDPECFDRTLRVLAEAIETAVWSDSGTSDAAESVSRDQ